MIKIKGNPVVKDTETSSKVNIFGTECSVHMRSVDIGSTTATEITGEDSDIKARISIKYPNGEVEPINTIVHGKASEVGLPSDLIEKFEKWLVKKLTENPQYDPITG